MALELLFIYRASRRDHDNDNDDATATVTTRSLLSNDDKRRRDRRTPRIALRKYPYSSFLYLYNSGNEQALINCCALDHNSFSQLLELFAPVFNVYTFEKSTNRIRKKMLTRDRKPKGRPREIDAIGCLCLVLYWY